jgi:hypothetical protein
VIFPYSLFYSSSFFLVDRPTSDEHLQAKIVVRTSFKRGHGSRPQIREESLLVLFSVHASITDMSFGQKSHQVSCLTVNID